VIECVLPEAMTVVEGGEAALGRFVAAPNRRAGLASQSLFDAMRFVSLGNAKIAEREASGPQALARRVQQRLGILALKLVGRDASDPEIVSRADVARMMNGSKPIRPDEVEIDSGDDGLRWLARFANRKKPTTLSSWSGALGAVTASID
jgi:hypothetical protein